MDWHKNGYVISTDKSRLHVDAIHSSLSQCYWSLGVPLHIIEKAIAGSICFGIYFDEQQVGFSRVITDHATFGYLADVYVVEEHKGKGLSKWMLSCVFSHPELQDLRRFMLATSDAHGLYQKFGFDELSKPEIMMEIARPDIYQEME